MIKKIIKNPKDSNIYSNNSKVNDTTPKGSHITAHCIFYKYQIPSGLIINR